MTAQEAIAKLKRFKYHAIGRLELEDAIDDVVSWYEQMMKEAVEGEVVKTDKHTSVKYQSNYGTDRYFYGIRDKKFKHGDKVRIIVLKDEQH